MLCGMKTRMSAARWERLVKTWEAAGQPADFAGKHGVAEGSLRWWKSELARRAKGATRGRPPRRPGPRVTLARVVREGARADEPVGGDGSLVVAVGGVRIVVERGFDASLLRAVVEALGAMS